MKYTPRNIKVYLKYILGVTMATKYPKPPIFDLFTIDELANRLGLTKRYLIEIEDGRKPANDRFMFRACAILNRPEAELFGPEESVA